VKIAVIDIGSHVLPYDYHLIKALVEDGKVVRYYGSNTKYNVEFIGRLKAMLSVDLILRDVSSSVANRFVNVFMYLLLLIEIWRDRKCHDVIIVQFCVSWFMELPLYFFLRKKLIFIVHNPIPHGYRGKRYLPYLFLANMAQKLWFPSEYSSVDFLSRYGENFKRKSVVVKHGLLALFPDNKPKPYIPIEKFEGYCYWSTVKPYKGVELMKELLESSTIRLKFSIEIYGLWDKSLYQMRDKLVSMGAKVEDCYLSVIELHDLLSRKLVFLLPYISASQSGALYTLLHEGCFFFATDVGDLGDFLRKYRLEGMILKNRDVESVERCMMYLENNMQYVVDALKKAQVDHEWSKIVNSVEVLESLKQVGDK